MCSLILTDYFNNREQRPEQTVLKHTRPKEAAAETKTVSFEIAMRMIADPVV